MSANNPISWKWTKKMNPLKPSERQEPSSLAPAQCSAAGVDKQDATDWQHFAKVFKSKEGCEPTRRDSKAEMCYEYYTAGAHDEFLGRLNQKQPNTEFGGASDASTATTVRR
jgi:hypothetical protein